MRERTIWTATLAALTLAAAACGGGGDGPTGTQPGTAGLRTVAGANVTDTVGARPVQALVVEVRAPGGALARGAVVRFETEGPAWYPAAGTPTVYACRISDTQCAGGIAVDTTDANGRAKVLVTFGGAAGRAVLRVLVPEFGFADSAAFTITAGAAAGVRLATADTSVTVGQSVTLAATVVDRFGNVRAGERATLSAGTGVDVDAAAQRLTGRAVGEYTVTARHESIRDTAVVRVVPEGRVAVWDASARAVRLVNLDGTAERTVATGVHSDWGAFPRLDGAGQVVLHTLAAGSWYGAPTLVTRLDTAGTGRVDLTAAEVGVTHVAYARALGDGRTRFLGYAAAEYRYPNTTPAAWAVWERRAGEAPVKLQDVPNYTGWYGGADLSPDGTKLAYVATGEYGAVTGLRVLDVATGTYTLVDAAGRTPRWSPAGDRLAYLIGTTGFSSGADGQPVVANADGSARRVIPGGVTFSPGLTWSPDGTWLLGRDAGAGRLRALRVSDGTGVRLRFVRTVGSGGSAYPSAVDYYQPDWR